LQLRRLSRFKPQESVPALAGIQEAWPRSAKYCLLSKTCYENVKQKKAETLNTVYVFNFFLIFKTL